MKFPDPRFKKGIDEFNARDYFLAHETWEALWHETTGPAKKILQGFIQTAVAFHHLKNGNANGARYLFGRFPGKLKPGGPSFWGADVAALLSDVKPCFKEPLIFRTEDIPLIHYK